jgi:hypothetical protein
MQISAIILSCETGQRVEDKAVRIVSRKDIFQAKTHGERKGAKKFIMHNQFLAEAQEAQRRREEICSST